MGTPWDVATVGWTVNVVCWLLTPIIASLAPKILSYLALDPEKKLKDLEFRIIPELQKILQAVDQERMMRRGDEKRMKGDVAKLDKLAAMLRHAQEDAEDIFDDAGEKIKSRCWQRLYGAFAACISLCKSSCVWIARTVHTRSSRTLQWTRSISLHLFLLLRKSEEPVPVNITDVVVSESESEEPAQVIIHIPASDFDPHPVTTNAGVSGDEIVPVTTGAAASDDVPIPVAFSAAASNNEPDPVTSSYEASNDETDLESTNAEASGDDIVPVTTSAGPSDDEPDTVTSISEDSESEEPAQVIIHIPASDFDPDPVTTNAGASDDEIVPVTTGAVASDDDPDLVTTGDKASDDELDPVTTSDEASDHDPVRVTFSDAASNNEPDPVTSSYEASNDETDLKSTNAEASGDEIVPVTTSAGPSDDEPDSVTSISEDSDDRDYSLPPPPSDSDHDSVRVTTPSDSSGRWISCFCSSFDFFKKCCTSLYNWLVHVFEAACFYRDWSYEVVGIKNCQKNALDSVLTAISRWKLKKRIEKVENTVTEVKNSPLLGVAREVTPNDVANKNRSRIKTASNRKVFGREALRDSVMAKLQETPHSDASSSSTSLCYSVIGIYGVAGSGKTTFARYIRDHIEEECKEEKLFDIITCIHLSETFSVKDIFREMLKNVTSHQFSSSTHCEELKVKMQDALWGKRFFLILDDLWVKNKYDPQLEELISPLNNAGLKGTKILVTSRTKDSAGALCTDEPIQMPDLDEDLYLKMFMHYALGGKRVVEEEFEPVGRVIAEKLHRSPIAAVTVAGRLRRNLDIKFWKNTAKLDMLNDTMDALWWSYQFLNPDIRRCFEYFNIFPRRTNLRRDKLVYMWIAQGFVKTSSATEDMEDVAEGYVQELASCLFLQPEGKGDGTDWFTIHDLLHDLLDKVTGSDYYRIENERSMTGEGWKGDVSRDVRHLFVQNYDAELITEKILGLENLRTLIIYKNDTLVEEKVFESICTRQPKLRVLAIVFNQESEPIWNPNKKFLVPECIIQSKHLRYLAIQISCTCVVILPSALAKLHHIQLLDFGAGFISVFTFVDLINLRHIFCGCENFPNVGRLSSIQTIPCFTVRNAQGYELKQLRDLNKLSGELKICGLENVENKDEALEANLAAKERLTELSLKWKPIRPAASEVEAEVEADVLEGLCPPAGLQTLHISDYRGSRYPGWMVGKQNGGPNDLKTLHFLRWEQLGPGPELEAFPHLQVLSLVGCDWDTLPGNMGHLTSLKELYISYCPNIKLLPTLPRSLELFYLYNSNGELTRSCETKGEPNWEKIEHIREKIIDHELI